MSRKCAYCFRRRPSHSLFFAVLLIFGLTSFGYADDPEAEDQQWMKGVPCRDDLERKSPVALDGKNFIICYKVNEKELKPSTTNVQLFVSIYSSLGTPMLTVESLAVANPRSQPGVTVSEQSKPKDHPKESTSQRTYRYDLGLDEKLKPEPYQMKLRVSLNNRDEDVFFNLPMGAAEGDWLELAKGSARAIECWSGSPCSPANLMFFNKLPYSLKITQISISSEHGDLLSPSATASPQTLKKGLSRQPVSIATAANPISLLRALDGLTIPKANLSLTYEDQYGREFLKEIGMDLEVRPNLVLLAVMLLLGAVVGTIVRIDLARLRRAGVITRRQQWVFAATTFASGVLVCLIALFTNLKLVAFADQNTYSAWDPRMLFLTSLIGTIGGIPILYALLKLPSASEGRPHQPATANAPTSDAPKGGLVQ